jgi:hypothetical protein
MPSLCSVVSISTSSDAHADGALAASMLCSPYLHATLQPQHPQDIDLSVINEQGLQDLANFISAYSVCSIDECLDKLASLWGLMQRDHADIQMTKAHKGINCLRARLLLLDRAERSWCQVRMQPPTALV